MQRRAQLIPLFISLSLFLLVGCEEKPPREPIHEKENNGDISYEKLLKTVVEEETEHIKNVDYSLPWIDKDGSIRLHPMSSSLHKEKIGIVREYTITDHTVDPELFELDLILAQSFLFSDCKNLGAFFTETNTEHVYKVYLNKEKLLWEEKVNKETCKQIRNETRDFDLPQ